MRIVLLILLLCPAVSYADRGALTLEAGGGFAFLTVPTPYASHGAVFGYSAATHIEARYAVSNSLELALKATFEPPATYYHNASQISVNGTVYPGTLKHTLYSYGALAGLRYTRGLIWRPFVACQFGWIHRAYDNFEAIDDTTDPSAPTDYNLTLAAINRDHALLAVSAGIAWTGDNLAIGIAPTLQYLIGANALPVLGVPITFSWSWYL